MQSLLFAVLLASNPGDQDAAAALALAAARHHVVAAVQPKCECDKTGQCLCSPYCMCPDSKAGYNAIIDRAKAKRIALVISAGVPRRDIAGASTVGYSEWCSPKTCYPNNIIVAWPCDERFGPTNMVFYVLPGAATDAQIQEMIRKTVPKPEAVSQSPYVSPPGTHRHQDSQGHTWEHSNSNVGRVAPHVSPWTGEVVFPRYYGPKPPERIGGLSAMPSFGFACST